MIKLFLVGVLAYGVFSYMNIDGFLIGNKNLSALMQGVKQTAVEETVRNYYRTYILNDPSALRDSTDTVTITYTDINGDGRKDAIAIVSAPNTCGTGGCIATIFLQDEYKQFTSVGVEYAVKDIYALESITNGMRDLRVNNDTRSRLVWNGKSYQIESLE